MNDTPDKLTLIENKIDPQVLGDIEIAPNFGGVALSDIREVNEIAKMMALADFCVPPHLRGRHGPCFALCMYALEWRMSPFAVANKSYVVNDRLAFESQLVHAVIEQRAPLKGRLRHEFGGEGPTRTCTVFATPVGEDTPLTWTSTEIGKIKIKNSAEWSNNPDKQLFYHTSRDWCRIYFPDVILGVYTDEEMNDPDYRGADNAKDVSPKLMERLPGRVEGAGFQPDNAEAARQEQEALDKQAKIKAERIENLKKARAARGKGGKGHKVSRRPGRPAAVGRRGARLEEGGATTTTTEVKTDPEAPTEPAFTPGEPGRWGIPRSRAQYIEYAQYWIKQIEREADVEAWFRSEYEFGLRQQCGVDEQTYKMLTTLVQGRGQ